MKKSPASLGIIVTLVVGVAFLFVLILSQRDEIKNGSDVAVLAEELGMDKDQFLADMESQEVKDIVKAQEEDGLQRLDNKASTPSIFINGEKFTRQTETDLQERLQVLVEESKVEGSSVTLPITLEVFEDYNCPACFQFQYSIHEIETEFSKSEVSIEKKHLPFLKESSEKYARAEVAAAKQDKAHQYNIELFMMVQNKTYDFYSRDTYQAPE